MLKNIQLGTKLIGGFLTVALLALILGIFGYYQIHKLAKADSMLYQQIAVPLGQLTAISTDFQRIRVSSRDILRVEKEDQEEFSERIDELFASMDKEAAVYEKTVFHERDKLMFKEFRDAQAAFKNSTHKIINLVNEDKLQEATDVLSGETEQATRALQTAIKTLQEGKTKQGQTMSDLNKVLADRSGWTMLGLAILSAVVAFVLGTLITRSVVGPVNALASDARRVADGDLLVEIKIVSQDEIGELGASFRAARSAVLQPQWQQPQTSSRPQPKSWLPVLKKWQLRQALLPLPLKRCLLQLQPLPKAAIRLPTAPNWPPGPPPVAQK